MGITVAACDHDCRHVVHVHDIFVFWPFVEGAFDSFVAHVLPVYVQVVFVAWLVATAWFLVTYHSPCQQLPSKEQLSYYESSGEDQDIYAGVSGFDSRGLKFFPQLW